MQSVYFDASVLIAAILSPSGGSSKLLTFVKKKHIAGITSQTVIEEVIAHAEKMNTSSHHILHYVKESSLLVRRGITREEVAPYENRVDKKDAHVIAGALLSHSTHLVTLDKKHLLVPKIQKQFPKLTIGNPKTLLSKLLTGGKE